MDTAVVFKIDAQRLAMHVTVVRRVIWSVEVTALPGQSEKLLGVIDVEGTIIPVVNFRNFLKIPPKEIDLEDHMVILEATVGAIAIVVDGIDMVLHYQPEQYTALENNHSSYASAILKIDGELIVLIDPNDLVDAHDLRGLLSAEALRPLSGALAR